MQTLQPFLSVHETILSIWTGNVDTLNDSYINYKIGKDVLVRGSNPKYLTTLSLQQEAGTPYSFIDTTIIGVSSPGQVVVFSQDNFQSIVQFRHTMEALVPPAFGGIAETIVSNPSELSDINDAEGRAILKMYSKLRSRTHSQFSALEFIGDLESTIHGLRHPAESLCKLVKSLTQKRELIERNKLNNLRRLRAQYERTDKRLLKLEAKLNQQYKTILSELWLEFNLGWKPLYGDISNVVKALHSKFSKPPRLIRFKTEEVVSSARGAIISPLTGFNVGTLDRLESVSLDAKLTVYTGVLAKVASTAQSPVQNLIRSSGMDFSTSAGLRVFFEDIIPAGWELTRYSFLIDYISNIGDIISAYNTYTADVVFNNIGREVNYNVQYSTQNFVLYTNNNYTRYVESFNPGSFQLSQLTYERKITPLAIPPVVFNKPGKIAQYITAASLALVSSKKSLRL